MSNKFDFFLKDHEIISQLNALETPLQNGLEERRNQTLM